MAVLQFLYAHAAIFATPARIESPTAHLADRIAPFAATDRSHAVGAEPVGAVIGREWRDAVWLGNAVLFRGH